MKHVHPDLYRAAFWQYLRHGTPIRTSIKQAAATERYVWRTRRDEKVRSSHRRNDGRIFSYGDALDTGHPGEGFNCRCEAVPYILGKTEFAVHDFTTSLASSYDRWMTNDFLDHYFGKTGRPVTLLEIGHLREIAEYYAFDDGIEGAFRRLSDQIAVEARKVESRMITYPFGFFYDFSDVSFSHGDSTVRGVFSGAVERRGAMLIIRGETRFEFSDDFVDPTDIGIEPGGVPYHVSGNWTTSFTAEVFKDERRSDFFDPEAR